MEITDAMVEKLASLISDGLRGDFEEYYLTGRLRDTITVRKGAGGSVVINIPAEAYDVDIFMKKHVVVNRPDLGSYAQLVNETGGFSGIHKGYVERALDMAILAWLRYYKLQAEVVNG